MAESFTFKVEGFKELEEVLVQMGEDFCYGKTASKVLLPAIKIAMQPVLAHSRAITPYDEQNTTTKHLRDTLRISARVPSPRDQRSHFADKDDIAIGLVSIRSDKRGISQEFGNARTSAQPYLRPALESQAHRVVSLLGTYLAYKLDQYKSKKV